MSKKSTSLTSAVPYTIISARVSPHAWNMARFFYHRRNLISKTKYSAVDEAGGHVPLRGSPMQSVPHVP